MVGQFGRGQSLFKVIPVCGHKIEVVHHIGHVAGQMLGYGTFRNDPPLVVEQERKHKVKVGGISYFGNAEVGLTAEIRF